MTFDEYEYEFNELLSTKGRRRRPRRPPALREKNVKLRTFMHYTDPDADKPDITVFGQKKKGLFYNYDDRLYGEKWNEGCKIAAATEGVVGESARFYEIVLNHYHGVDDVDLQHVLLGVNRSNGYSYLVFGYTYTLEKEKKNK